MRSTSSEGPKLLGIGGGVASGKSTVASLLREQGIPVLVLDDLARKLSAKGKPMWKAIVCVFGQSFLNARGMLQREKLARVVFRSWRMLFVLNALAHPLLFFETWRWLRRFEKGWVAIEGAVLFEAGFCPLLSKLLFVDAPQELRVARLREKGIGEKDIQIRLRAQRFLACLRRRASKILENAFSMEFLEQEVSSLLRDSSFWK
ncbi:MAG: dephospho-CoA kinase [Candidatus Caldatribacterium sp.]|uniref:dephospho-CoA kinase n=1 Tax=Candidatus Caldatribacterium sp. TaxID=2282143 RepID=UPI0029921D5A|nr:dephospho-CoA kinase [Candidatus Caldatribacterium sp.]MCX7730877.1 dephospho-CoA kinase [Candidatus Caldatribacterium sp.]MDW8080883.1 dephospho-CoA kinase [Candidatus Calescibacterium sp.]